MELATSPGHAISEVNLKIVMSRETFRLLSDLNYRMDQSFYTSSLDTTFEKRMIQYCISSHPRAALEANKLADQATSLH
jgi:hypothetical protein